MLLGRISFPEHARSQVKGGLKCGLRLLRMGMSSNIEAVRPLFLGRRKGGGGVEEGRRKGGGGAEECGGVRRRSEEE